MNKLIISILAVLVLAMGGLSLRKPSIVVNVPAPVVNINGGQNTFDPNDGKAGAAAGPNHYTLENFWNGLGFSKFYGLGSVNASTTSSTGDSITRILGAGTHGQFTLGSATPASSLMSASTTAVTLNSMVFLQQTSTTTIGGVTCNSTATVTPVTKIIFASSTSLTNNGFTATANGIPATNPLCYNYWILDKSQ